MKIHLLDAEATIPTQLSMLSYYNQIKRLPYWAESDCFYSLREAENNNGPENLSDARNVINTTWNSSIPRDYPDNRGSCFQLSTMVHFRHKITPLSNEARKIFVETGLKETVSLNFKRKYLIKRGYK